MLDFQQFLLRFSDNLKNLLEDVQEKTPDYNLLVNVNLLKNMILQYLKCSCNSLF